MSTKEQLINLIKIWRESDNEIKKLQDNVKKKKEDKKAITEELLEVMKTNEIDCFDIKNGKLQYKTIKTKQPISKKSLLESLSKYFSNDEKMATEVTEFILDSRAEKITETIKRKTIK